MSLIDFAVTNRAPRMDKLSVGAPVEEFGSRRRCTAPDCGAVLSRYNPSTTCSLHRGWRGGHPTRRPS